ncbi:N-acetyl-gamma-glutamyl-phosphate reductase [Desulfovibrionales bacterium]
MRTFSVPPISVGLVGVTGYAGIELVRLLVGHPGLSLVRATSRTEVGRTLVAVYPFFQGYSRAELTITALDLDDLAAVCKLVFLAVPHGIAMSMAGHLRRKGVKVVDLSADFRLRDPEVYAQWYGLDHCEVGCLGEAVYGLVEHAREAIRRAELVANPGCYPTAVILGLFPALKARIVEPEGIVIDAKSGTSGAGHRVTADMLFCEVYDNFRAYNLGKHRHTPEIEQELSLVAGSPITVSLNTHLLPISRGILVTIYTRLIRPMELVEVRAIYEAVYGQERWVRLLPPGQLPEVRFVRGTMYCDMGLVVDPRTQRLLILTAIDNLCRGASGQALANANLMLDLDGAMGLGAPSFMP